MSSESEAPYQSGSYTQRRREQRDVRLVLRRVVPVLVTKSPADALATPTRSIRLALGYLESLTRIAYLYTNNQSKEKVRLPTMPAQSAAAPGHPHIHHHHHHLTLSHPSTPPSTHTGTTMAFLPSIPLTLRGGCYCGAAAYTIHIPPASERPTIPGAGPVPTSPSTSAPTTTFPVVAICHCRSCRRVSGALFFSWLVAPPGWVTWDVLVKPQKLNSSWPGNGVMRGAGRAAGDVEENEGEREGEEEGERIRDVPSTAIAAPPPDTDTYTPTTNPPLPAATYITQHRSSSRAIRTFCARCGTQLTYYHLAHHATEWAMLDVSVGSLDEASIRLVRPERQAWWDGGVEWIREMVRWGAGGWMVRMRGVEPGEVVGDDDDRERGAGEGQGKGMWMKLHVDADGDGGGE